MFASCLQRASWAIAIPKSAEVWMWIAENQRRVQERVDDVLDVGVSQDRGPYGTSRCRSVFLFWFPPSRPCFSDSLQTAGPARPGGSQDRDRRDQALSMPRIPKCCDGSKPGVTLRVPLGLRGRRRFGVTLSFFCWPNRRVGTVVSFGYGPQVLVSFVFSSQNNFILGSPSFL